MNSFEKISVVGNGLSAWMMCAFLANQLKHTDTKITLYCGVDEEPTQGIQSPLPLINDFLKEVNISPEALTRAGFHPKLGTAFLFDKQKPFFHIWGEYGASLDFARFHQVVCKARMKGVSVDLNKMSIASASVLANKFRSPVRQADSIYSTYESSWSFETKNFQELLKSICNQLEVEVNEKRVKALVCEESVGYVVHESGDHDASDYIVNTVLEFAQGKDTEPALESWFVSLPIELHSQEQVANNFSALVNNVVTRADTSWIQDVSHRHRVLRMVYRFSNTDNGNVYVHRSPREKRCLHIGPALARLYSPLVSPTDIDLIAMKLLSRYFPSPSDTPAVFDLFNRSLRSALANLRDATQLCLSSLFAKNGSFDFNVPLSDQAKYKKVLFEHRGRLPSMENEFYKTEWQTWLLLGLETSVKNVEPLTSFIEDGKIAGHIDRVEKAILRELPSIPMVS